MPAAARTSAAAGRSDESGLQRARSRLYLPFLLPALLLYIVLFVVPSLASVGFSLMKWGGLGSDMSWNGLGNYVRLFTNPAFGTSFLNTLLLTIVGGLIVFGVAFLSMVVLREMRGRAFIRAVVFVPYILSPIAIGAAIGFLLNPDGAINLILRTIGLDSLALAWLSPDLVFKVIIIGFIWSTTGFYVALMMSGVDSISPSLYEAAKLSGASRLQQFRYVTFPLTRDILATAAVLWVINGIKVFEIVIAFTGTAGTPPLQARTVAVQQYLSVTGGRDGVPDLGYASAIGVVMFVLCSVLVVLVRRILRTESIEQ